jgi:hypothetical protein
MANFIGYGQDIHWSQFNDNPIFQNPANTGEFNGDTRFIGNFRDQWRSVSVPFQTFNVCVDRKSKHFNYGLLIYFDSQYNGYIFNPLLPTNEIFQTDRKTNANIGLGAQYGWNISSRKYLKIGLSAFNLNRPNQGFYQDVIKRDLRWVWQVKYSQALNARWDILPSLQYSKQGTYDEVMLGSSVRYYLPGSDKNYIHKALLAGVWSRARDAQILSVGCEYKDWFVGLSYDINTSKLVPASKARGGFEIAVRYIMYRFKPKRIDHRVCPDFI